MAATRPWLRWFDIVLAPFVLASVLPMKAARRAGMHNLPITRRLLQLAGVFPLINHYYEPLFDTRALKPLDTPRALPGIDFRLDAQLALLGSFDDMAVVIAIDAQPAGSLAYSFENTSFGSGDAELWFHMISNTKPARIVEIGSGHSTKMARAAIASLQARDPAYSCDHICIEPYEQPWLERTGARIVRSKVEDVDRALFDTLAAGDILFIDSSHMIRPQGDVLVEYLEILPRLAAGVIVHIHDIFTPRDYPDQWVRDEIRFWNEQYLLEAFLTENPSWEVVLAANMLAHAAPEALRAKCPFLPVGREPGSFYIRKLGGVDAAS